MLAFLAVSVFFLAVFAALLDCYRRTGFVPPALSMLSNAFGGAFYTWMQGLGVTNLTTTFTHSLGLNGTNYVARILMKGNVGATQTAGLQVVGVSTNTITVVPMLASTLITFDLEVQQVHSLIA